MREQTIGKFLDELAERLPVPGGGSTAALHVAQAAGLVAMVARYSRGAKFAEHATKVNRVIEVSDDARREGLRLLEDDIRAFGEVADAYGLPRATDEQRSARSAAIASALANAAVPPAAVVSLADRVLGYAEELLPIGNHNVITDLAAAAEAARAAAVTARVNVEVNLNGVRDAGTREELSLAMGSVDSITRRADAVTSAVREVVAR